MTITKPTLEALQRATWDGGIVPASIEDAHTIAEYLGSGMRTQLVTAAIKHGASPKDWVAEHCDGGRVVYATMHDTHHAAAAHVLGSSDKGITHFTIRRVR